VENGVVAVCNIWCSDCDTTKTEATSHVTYNSHSSNG